MEKLKKIQCLIAAVLFTFQPCSLEKIKNVARIIIKKHKKLKKILLKLKVRHDNIIILIYRNTKRGNIFENKIKSDRA